MNKRRKYISYKKKKVVNGIWVGAIVGILNGFFSGGGGLICEPLLEKIFNLDNKHAHATCLLVMLPLSIFSSIVYIVSNSIDFSVLMLITLGSVIGSIIGALLLKKLNSKIIRFIFAVVVIIAGIKMVM